MIETEVLFLISMEYPDALFQIEPDIPSKRSRIDCTKDGDLIASTPQTGLSSRSRVGRKTPSKGIGTNSILNYIVHLEKQIGTLKYFKSKKFSRID